MQNDHRMIMKIAASIEFIYNLAAREAIAAEYKEIEPEHLLAAILKLSELPVAELDKMAPGAHAARELASDVEAARSELSDRAIDSTSVRRALRSAMGTGDCKFEGGMIHRSSGSREVFDRAARLAGDAGSEILSPIHLLEAILVSPSPTMEKILGEAVGPRIPRPTETPLLEEFGEDRTHLALSGKLPIAGDRAAECKALLHALAHDKRKCVFMVSNSQVTAQSVVTAAAHALATKQVPPGLRGSRIVDLTDPSRFAKDLASALDQMDRLFVEAAEAPEVILFLPAVEPPRSPESAHRWLDMLRSALTVRATRCVCRVAPIAYQSLIKRDVVFKQFSSTMWISDQAISDVPTEL